MAKKLKKDFDKEIMYSKIMPSMVTPAPQHQKREEPVSEELSLEQESPQEEQQPQYVLRNFIEDIVMDRMGRTIAMLRGCECERCQKDVMALALNELPPAYLVVEPEELEEAVRQLRKECEVKVSSALIKAVQTVKASPNH